MFTDIIPDHGTCLVTCAVRIMCVPFLCILIHSSTRIQVLYLHYDVLRCAPCRYGYAQSMYGFSFLVYVGDGVMKYDVMRVVTAGRHEIEVIAYCKGASVDSEKHRFRGLLDDM